jgi:hypothetical protein
VRYGIMHGGRIGDTITSLITRLNKQSVSSYTGNNGGERGDLHFNTRKVLVYINTSYQFLIAINGI